MTARTWWTSLLAGCCILALHVDRAAAQPAAAKAKSTSMRTMTYPVADLVVPATDNPRVKAKTNEEALMTLIKNVIAPTTWESAGGSGQMQYFPAGMALVVKADVEIQAEVGEMLKALRRLHDLEVCIEARIVETSPEMATLWQRKSGMVGADGKAKAVTMVSPEQLHSLMAEAQECKQTCVVQAPKVTVWNGQKADIVVADFRQFTTDYKTERKANWTYILPVSSQKKLGLVSEFTPIVSADRKSVRVKFRVEKSYLVGNVVKKSFRIQQVREDETAADCEGFLEMPNLSVLVAEMEKVIPVGKTLLVSMGETKCMSREDCFVPVLGELPLVGEWFRGTREVERTKHVFLMVTPRVLVLEEASVEIFEGAVAPIPRP